MKPIQMAILEAVAPFGGDLSFIRVQHNVTAGAPELFVERSIGGHRVGLTIIFDEHEYENASHDVVGDKVRLHLGTFNEFYPPDAS